MTEVGSGNDLHELSPNPISLVTLERIFMQCLNENSPPNGRGVFVQPLLKSDFLDKPSFSKTNPLSPCSLLGAFRLAARLNDSWYKLTDGKFDVDGRPELVQYEGELKDGKTLKRLANLVVFIYDFKII
jgi:hypothetical protein